MRVTGGGKFAANGQLSITIPVATVQARGNVSVPLTVSVTPAIWDITASSYEYNCSPGDCQIGWLYTMSFSGWLGGSVFGAGELAFRSSGDYCVPVNTSSSRWNSALTRGTFVAPDGTETEFIDQQTNGTPEAGNLGYNRGTKFIADNGSMALFTSSASISDTTSCLSSQTTYPSGTLALRGGTQYTITNGAVTRVEDHNGNYTSFGNPITDSIGRTYTVGGSGSTETLQYYGSGATLRTITVHYASLESVLASGSPETYGQLWSLPSGLQNASQQFNPNSMVSEIDLPNGSKYTFLYDSYGDVAQMTLPTGDYVQYSYTNAVNYGTTAPGTVDLTIGNGGPVATQVPSAYMYTLSRSLQERRVYVNGNYMGKTDFPSTSEIDWYDGPGNLLAKQTQTISSAGTLPSSGTNYNPPQYNQRTALNYYDAGGSTLLESQTMAYYQPSNCKVNCPTIETLDY